MTETTADESDVTEYVYDAYGCFSSLTKPFDETTSVTYGEPWVAPAWAPVV